MTSSIDPVQAELTIQTRQSEYATWVLVHGQADISNRALLDGALMQLDLDGTRSVHVHVSGLDFCDVGSLRHLCSFARQMRRGGRDFRTCGAKPMFRKMSHLLGFDNDLGLA